MSIKKSPKKILIKGFTLIEMIVVVAVMSLLMVASIEIFSNMYSLSVRNNDSRLALQDARYALETISREARNSKELIPTSIIPDTYYIDLKNQQEQSVRFACVNCNNSSTNGRITMSVTNPDGTSRPLTYLTSDKIEVTQFYILPNEIASETTGLNRGGEYSPFFTLRIMARGKSLDKNGQKSVVTLATSVTRDPYSEYTYCDLFFCKKGIFFPHEHNKLFVYLPNEDVWMQRSDLTFSTDSGGGSIKGARVKDEIYFHAGTGNIDFYSYNSVIDKLRLKGNLPEAPTIDNDMVSSGQYIYYRPELGDSRMYRYDSSTSIWISIANVPGIRGSLSTPFNNENKIYIHTEEWIIYSYNPITDIWTEHINLGQNAACSIAVGSSIFSISSFSHRTMKEYNIDTGVVTNRKQPQLFDSAGESAGNGSCRLEYFNGKLYMANNSSMNGPNLTDFYGRIWEYDIANDIYGWSEKTRNPFLNFPRAVGRIIGN